MKLTMMMRSIMAGGNDTVSAPTINSVTVTGARRVGETLTAVVDATGADSLSYQWYRYGAAIFGETNSTCTLVSGDADQAVRVGVIAHNAGGDSAEAFSAWDAYAIPRKWDWTTYSNTTLGAAGTNGTTSAGLEGWTPMRSNNFRVLSGVAVATQTGGGFAYRSDIAYLTGRQRFNDRIAVQGGNQGASYDYPFGIAYNPTSGQGYIVRWNQTNRTISILRLMSAGAYPATSNPGIPSTVLSATTYASGASTDWCVAERALLGETSYITIMVCPDAGGYPDYENPRLTWTSADTYAPLAAEGYVFVASYSSVADPIQFPRFEVTSRAFEFTNAARIAKNTTSTLALTGKDTLWDGSTVFTATAGITINSAMINSTTNATLNVTMANAVADVTLSDGNVSQRIYVRASASAESRQVYAAERNTKAIKIPATNTASVSTFVSSAATYGVGFSADGQYVYLCNASNVLKYNLAGVLQATITYTGISNARKMLTLPSSDYLVCNYGTSIIQRLNSSDVDQGQWAAPAGGALGMTVFYDQTLARNTVLVAGWGSQKIWQYEIDGTLIATWATSLGGNISDVGVDSGGSVYAVDWTNGRILKFSNAGVAQGALVSTLTAPHGLVVLNDDTILVACETGSYANRIRAFAPSGAELGDIINTNMSAYAVDVKVIPV